MALERSIISWDTPANETQTVSEVAISREVCLLEGIRDLYSTKAFTDIIITVAGKDFHCHKLILAVCSPFFMAMFSNDMCEMRQERIEMKEMTSITMELVLEYIYTGEMNFGDDTVQNLLSAANMLELIALRDGCEKFMMDKVTATNCIGMYIFAKAHQCETLAKKSKDIMNNTFAQLCHEDEFLMLPYDKFIEIIQDDAINVDKEEQIYEACLAWLRSDLANRKRYLVDVMKHVRFANINCYYFCDVIDPLPLLRECDEIQRLLSVVKYQHMLKDRRCEVDLNLVPRRGMSYERGVLIISNPNHDDYLKKCNIMEFLVPSTGEIKYICKLPHGIYMPGVCVTGDNQIYVAGGEIRQSDQNGAFLTEGVTASVFLFDKTFKSWQVKAKMNYARSRFALVLVDGLIYAVGGQGSNDLLDVVECYSPALNEWRVVSPLPRKLQSVTAVSYRGRLYCFGGDTGSEIKNSAYRYSVNDDHWIELPPMNIPRALAGSVVYKDHIYVMGGNTVFSMQWKWELLPEHCTNTVEIFNPETDTWRFGSDMPNSLCGIGVAKYGGTVIAVGGENEKCWIAGLFLLKNENGKEVWTKCQELSDVLSMFGCGVANMPKSLLQDVGQS